MKAVRITGNNRVKEGETLNLSCSVESFPPSLITWSKSSDKYVQNGTETNLKNDTSTHLLNETFSDLKNDTETSVKNDTETYLSEESGMKSFSISNVRVEDSGQYICTAKHLNKTQVETVDVTVICKYTV